MQKGEVEVALAGRPFRIRKEFLDDVAEQKLADCLANLRKALLVLHSPTDDLVGIENASAIFTAAKHPKSFVSLAGADHLLEQAARRGLCGRGDRRVVGALSRHGARSRTRCRSRACWSPRRGNGKFEQSIIAGPHRYLADEPVSAGGNGSGPSPYEYLLAGARRLHVDDDPALCRPEEDSARARRRCAAPRQDPCGGLRGLRDQGGQDRPHRARGDAGGRSLGRAAREADGDRRQVPGAPHAAPPRSTSGPGSRRPHEHRDRRGGAGGRATGAEPAPGRLQGRRSA